MRTLLLTTLLLPTLSLAETLALYAWPLSSPSPSPLATIQYTPPSLPSSTSPSTAIPAKADTWTPPRLDDANGDDLIRIGLYDAKTKSWTGVVTSAASLVPGLEKKVTLRVDAEGQVWGLSFVAGVAPGPRKAGRAKGTSGEDAKEAADVTVEIVGVHRGPEPVLNRPVVLSAEGKVQEKEEKTFLQK